MSSFVGLESCLEPYEILMELCLEGNMSILKVPQLFLQNIRTIETFKYH